MRYLSAGLIAIASLSLTSCSPGDIANPPVATGLLKLTLTPATITKCQSVGLSDPYVKNTALKGRSFVEVKEKGILEPVGRYPNATSATMVLDGAGDYFIIYSIQYPKYPEKLSLTFRCTKSGAESTQEFTITETSGEQTVNLSFS